MRCLIAEDEPLAARTLTRVVARAAFEVDVARDGDAALRLAGEHAYHLILLDWSLPGPNGLALCRALRRLTPKSAIVMVTGRDDMGDKVSALDAGADDFITKPYEVRELVARMLAVVRRTCQPETPLRKAGPLQIDHHEGRVEVRGVKADLTPSEFRLLRYLIQRTGETVSREDILNHVWGEELDPRTSRVPVLVHQLREKLGPSKRFIRSVRGQGYRLDAEPAEGEAEEP
jgi:DNA-binding response OmpR family regulator